MKKMAENVRYQINSIQTAMDKKKVVGVISLADLAGESDSNDDDFLLG